MKKIIFVIITILLASFVLAQEIPSAEQVFTEETFLQEIQNTYNQQRHSAPEFFINLFGNERVNIYMNGIDIHVVMVDGEMTDLGTGEITDQTMNVYVSKETTEQIMREELSLKQALDTGLIRYEGVGFGKKIKFGAVKVLYKVVSWFS